MSELINIIENQDVVLVEITQTPVEVIVTEQIANESVAVEPVIDEVEVIITVEEIVVNVKEITLEQLNTAGIKDLWTGLQAQYDAIPTPDPDVLYFITD